MFPLTAQIKGGRTSWINRRNNPNYYRLKGCVIANEFIYPMQFTADLSEFIGIVLGDGGLTDSQLSITLNRIADKQYISYVRQLIIKLFSYTPTIFERNDSKATVIRVNGVDFIKYLNRLGLIIGNKVVNQVDVPDWIKTNSEFSQKCVRGLVDTDGCVFINKYLVNSRWYQYKKLAFSNRSKPLLNFVYNTLTNIGLQPIHYQGKQVRLCRYKQVEKYMMSIGSSNQRLLKFFT